MAFKGVDTKLLNKYIKRSGYLKSYIAENLNITTVSLSAKLNNRQKFQGSEMYNMKKLLNLSDREFMDVFFADDVDQCSTKGRNNA